MSNPAARDAVAETLRRINRTWLEGRPRDMAPFLHPDVVMVVPGFAARVSGRDAFIAGFVAFGQSAALEEYGESDLQIDVTSTGAVASYAFEMVYERAGIAYRAKGRDLWFFALQDDRWQAVWRTMLDLTEQPI